jgi:hypothetical protein
MIPAVSVDISPRFPDKVWPLMILYHLLFRTRVKTPRFAEKITGRAREVVKELSKLGSSERRPSFSGEPLAAGRFSYSASLSWSSIVMCRAVFLPIEGISFSRLT